MAKLQLRYRHNGFEYVPQFWGKSSDPEKPGEWRDFKYGDNHQIPRDSYLSRLGDQLAVLQRVSWKHDAQWYAQKSKENDGQMIYFKTKPLVCAWLAAVQAFYSDNIYINFNLDIPEMPENPTE